MAARETTAVVREESHLDDMRAALRADFERLERRRGRQSLMEGRRREEPFADTDDEHDTGAGDRSWLARLLGR